MVRLTVYPISVHLGYGQFHVVCCPRYSLGLGRERASEKPCLSEAAAFHLDYRFPLHASLWVLLITFRDSISIR